MWLLRHSLRLSVCDDTAERGFDCACGTQITPVTIFGYQITMNNWMLMFVYYPAGVLCSFFLSYSDLFLHTLARCSGYCCIWSHWQTHTRTRWDSSGRVISPSQWPLLDDTQHSQDRGIHGPGSIRTRNPNKRAAVQPRLRPRGPRSFHSVYFAWVQVYSVSTNARSKRKKKRHTAYFVW